MRKWKFRNAEEFVQSPSLGDRTKAGNHLFIFSTNYLMSESVGMLMRKESIHA